jgi:L-alanine-DL-glutamate epimerase-like enolase superfamily enzyme
MQAVHKISEVHATAYTVPADAPEADGTLAWNSTTMLLVEVAAGGQHGIGYSYTHRSAAIVARELLQKHVQGADAVNGPALFGAMQADQRNYGREGIAAAALSAIDVALWDLKAKLLDEPLYTLLGAVRNGVEVYGSGGFTSYSDAQLTQQLAGWVEEGIPRVKMKIGTHPDDDLRRVHVARKAIGEKAKLFVDANGAYTRKQALHFAERFVSECDVTWFEEPVSSDDLVGLRFLREHVPASMEIAAGEYGWTQLYLQRMMHAGAVDVIQADATRCGGVTGFLQAAATAEQAQLPLSAHCAPSLHMHLGCVAQPLRHVEYFYDHVRIEQMLFDGFRAPRDGVMRPDLARTGLGLEFKSQDAERYRDDL